MLTINKILIKYNYFPTWNKKIAMKFSKLVEIFETFKFLHVKSRQHFEKKSENEILFLNFSKQSRDTVLVSF